ncbi:MAG: chromate transporter [Clostridia bacterium]|nr:chromate transporter [Clostridia bacterium]
MILLQLLWGFFKVGCFSFGGAYAAIPLIREVVLSYGWLSDEMLTYMIAVSESTPGPIMVNLATYVGTAEAGLAGALTATFAVVLPSFLLVLLLTAVLSRVIKNPYVQAVLRGLKPCMIGIILVTGGRMIIQNLFEESGTFDPRALLITALLACVYFSRGRLFKKSLSPILLIVLAALLGMIVYAL